jgi:hypothetical protein
MNFFMYQLMSEKNRSYLIYLQVKNMYQRVANQNESLKGLWAAKMNLKGQAILATDDDLAVYDWKLKALENELERRKDVGRQFEEILIRQKELMSGLVKIMDVRIQIHWWAGITTISKNHFVFDIK